ncbi:CheR family methyltransferase [Aquitalea aquatica]|uniref:Chemotaxis protein methyltransferase n=1 Tax=Aquitalea aquatica TaxID=3044273 RepID=A0A838XYU7_9NEIS|nr:CheR family methyltransferase [Aquitalea magnusonii]MBA4707903.1 chemotaxis protein CheR [Aquitalea magnusonii]
MSTERDIKFTAADFRRLRQMLYQRVGISLNDSKSHMAYSRLAKRVRQLGMRQFADYLDLLEKSEGEAEWQHFVNALTTNLTAFFREPHHFDLLRLHAMERVAQERHYRVWSAAVSTGEEAYSIAMTLLSLPQLNRQRLELVASDIDTRVLSQAADGVYDAERAKVLDSSLLKRFFLRGVGHNAGKVRIRREVREQLSFYQFNLVAAEWPDMGRFDVIFCRNVLIYFDKPTQAAILQRLAASLQPDGLLFLGHSENIQHLSDAFQSCGRTAYRLANHNVRR